MAADEDDDDDDDTEVLKVVEEWTEEEQEVECLRYSLGEVEVGLGLSTLAATLSREVDIR